MCLVSCCQRYQDQTLLVKPRLALCFCRWHSSIYRFDLRMEVERARQHELWRKRRILTQKVMEVPCRVLPTCMVKFAFCCCLAIFFWENSCLKKLFLCRFFVICVRFCIGLDVRGSKQRQNPKGFFSSSNGCQNFALTCLVSRFFSPRWCDFLINKMVRKLRLFGGTKQCKCMVLVRDFPFIVPCFGLIIHHAPLSRGSMFWWKISVIGPRSFCRLAGRGAADKGPENLRATTLTKRGCWNTTKQWTQGNATPAGAVEKTGIRLGSMVVSAMHSDTNQNFQLKISKMQLKMNLSSEIKKNQSI